VFYLQPWGITITKKNYVCEGASFCAMSCQQNPDYISANQPNQSDLLYCEIGQIMAEE
jgi:hypothetical protein